LIALAHREHGAVVGVVSAPALGRRWWAARGLGSFADGRPCQVSDISDIADSQLCVTFSPGWEELGLLERLVELLSSARRARGFGDFWQHCLVAEGAVDVAIDAVGLKPYDLAAVKVVVEEAGGTFTDRHGVATHEHDTAISSNGLLHATVVQALAG
jgi:histidinol-phosphatase